MKTFWKHSKLDGERIWEHYDHNITVANYGDGQCYSLECLDCNEVILDSDTCPDSYRMLKYCYEQELVGYKPFFSRYGGLYGELNVGNDKEAKLVCRSKKLI